MKYSGLYTFDRDTHKYAPVSLIKAIWDVEEDDDMRFHRPHPRNPLVDGWICPYCGKRVYSMEVHPCNQPYCGQPRDDGWYPGGCDWDEFGEMPKWEDKDEL